jgi:hypothetical protein
MLASSASAKPHTTVASFAGGIAGIRQHTAACVSMTYADVC